MRIAITGAHGTWKSTLLSDLKKTEQLKHIPTIEEIARAMIAGGHVMGTEEFQREVIKRQIEAENALESFMSDRSVFDNLAYSKAISEELYQELKEISWNQIYDKIVFLPIDFDLVDDWVRFTNLKFQREIQNHIIQILTDTNTHFHIITWDTEERVEKALEYINS